MRLGYTVPLLLIAAALAFAASASSHSPEPPRSVSTAREGSPSIASSLEVTVGEEVRFAFHVTNSSRKRVELRFPSGQTHDLVVLDAQGREVWRWSRGRIFTQTMQNKMLGASDTLTFTETWQAAGTGTYTAVASLLSENFPAEQQAEFALPAKSVGTR